MKKTKDLVTGIMVFLVAFLYIINAFSVKVFTGIGATTINSRTIPLIFGFCLVLLSVLLVVRAVRSQEQSGSGTTSTFGEKASYTSLRFKYAVPVTFVLLILYVFLLKRAGFVPMTIAYLSLQILLLYPEGKKRYWLVAAVSIVFSFLVYALFVYCLNVPLPSGIMPF